MSNIAFLIKIVSAHAIYRKQMADDTSSSHSGRDLKRVLENLQEDAKNILQFMASNGIVAYPSKTKFMLLNNTQKEQH